MSRDHQLDLGRLRVSISFGRANAVFFEASDCVVSHIADSGRIGAMVIDLHGRAKWETGHVVITELVTAGAITVLISDRGPAQIELRITSTGSQAPTSIASATAAVEKVSNMAFTIHGSSVTPLFRVGEVERSLWRRARFVVRPNSGPRASSLVSEEG
jgi:hypothetical protein